MEGTGSAAAGMRASRVADWRWALPRIAVLFVATRALLVGVALAVELTQAAPAPGVRWSDAPLLASLTAFDGRYYMGIAAAGYHAGPVYGPYVDHVFFPLYPLITRLVSLLTLGSVDVAGVLTANAAFGAALVVLYALGVRHMPREAALWSLVFLAVAPGAAAFGMAYTDSLLLLLAVGACYAVELRRPWVAGALLGLAALTRPPGILLAIPLFLLMWDDPALRRPRAWAALVLGPVALVEFSLYLGSVTGDPLAWIHGQARWIGLSPGAGSVDATTSAGAGAAAPGAPVGMAPAGIAPTVLWLATLLWYVFLGVFFRRDGMPRGYVAWAILTVATVFPAGRLQPAPRYLALGWPFDWTLALRRSRWVRLVVLPVSIALQCLLMVAAFTWLSAP